MSDPSLCRRCQEELAYGGREALAEELGPHMEVCSDCRAFLETASPLLQLAELDPGLAPVRLVFETLSRMRPNLMARSRTARRLGFRLALAGATSLPVILVVNTGLVWMVASLLGQWIGEPAAWLVVYLGLASTLLGLSLLYGALPLLAAWGAQLRQEA